MKKMSLVFCLSVLLIGGISAQSKPLTAVMPFGSRNVSQSDASIVTSLFETALVKTESFKVIEQNQVEEILEAQAFTLTGCTDESCAVEFGKLLAAEQIILGDFSRLGGKYILNVKVIDVELGENLRADSVTFNSLDDIQEEAELLAFKLAGLTYSRSGSVKIATEFGDLFIETDPSPADIYINGIPKGKSPDLFQRVPLGEVVVEARFENLYARETVDLNEGIAELSMILKQTFGNLFIKSTKDNVDVFLDRSSLGALGSGLYKDIPAGRKRLELIGDGLYWEGNIEILENESVVVEAKPKEVGTLNLYLPPGVSAVLKGPEGQYQMTNANSKLERIWAGEYQMTVTGEGVEEFSGTVVIRRGKTTSLRPDLNITAAGMEKQTEELMSTLMDKTAEPISYEEFRDLRTRVTAYYRDLEERGYPELASRVRGLFKDITENELSKYETKLSELESEKAGMAGSGRVRRPSKPLMLLSGVLIASAGVTAYLMSDAYSQYKDAEYSSDAVSLREQTQTYMFLSIGTGAAGLGTGIFSLAKGRTDPEVKRLDREIDALRKQIVELKWLIDKLEKEEAA